GAGRGTTLRDVLIAIERERGEAGRNLHAAILEVSPRLRSEQSAALEGRDIRWASEVRALAPLLGVIYANEVLDAFPVHVLARTDDGIREIYVEERDGRLAESLRPPSADLRYRVPE